MSMIYECRFCKANGSDRYFSNKGMLVFHLRSTHKLSQLLEKNIKFETWLVPEPEKEKAPIGWDENDQILINRNRKAKQELTPIYCKGCGKLIAKYEMLVTPTTFKIHYGSKCKHCGRELDPIFDIKDFKIRKQSSPD